MNVMKLELYQNGYQHCKMQRCGFFVPLPLLHMFNSDWLKENINSPIMCAAFIQQIRFELNIII